MTILREMPGWANEGAWRTSQPGWLTNTDTQLERLPGHNSAPTLAGSRTHTGWLTHSRAFASGGGGGAKRTREQKEDRDERTRRRQKSRGKQSAVYFVVVMLMGGDGRKLDLIVMSHQTAERGRENHGSHVPSMFRGLRMGRHRSVQGGSLSFLIPTVHRFL